MQLPDSKKARRRPAGGHVWLTHIFPLVVGLTSLTMHAGAQSAEPAPAEASAASAPAVNEPSTAEPARGTESAEESTDTAQPAGKGKPAAPSGAPSQPPAATANASESNAQIAGDELASLDTLGLFERAGEVHRELEAMTESLELPPHITELKAELNLRLVRVRQDALAAEESLALANRWFVESNIHFRFSKEARELSVLRAPIEKVSARRAATSKRLDEIAAEWKQAETTLRSLGASPESTARAGQVLRKAQVLQFHSSRGDAALARISSLFEQENALIESVIRSAEVGSSIERASKVRGATPWENVRSLPSFSEINRRVLQSLHLNSSLLAAAAAEHARRLAFQLGLFVAFVIFLVRTGRRLKQGNTQGTLLESTAYEHPIAASALVTAAATALLYSSLPASAVAIALVIATTGSAVILMSDRKEKYFKIGVLALTLLFFFLQNLLTVDVPGLEQLFLGLEGLLVIYCGQQLPKAVRLQATGMWLILGTSVARMWVIAGGVGLLAWAFGFNHVAHTLIDGSIRLMLVTLGFRGAYIVTSSLIRAAADSPRLQELNSINNHGPLLAQRLNTLLRTVLLLVWVRTFTGSYSLRSSLAGMLSEFWSTRFALGSLDFSIGDVLTLAMALVLAVVSSKVVKFFLEEDILPLTGLRLGTRAAMGAGLYYLMLCLGIFLALAAGGLKLDKLAILVSALGVGIGFGLQNIVQNFVSGLILIFGRPINVGDVVQLQELIGRVTKVGFRASTVRTFQGAEVIVPNSAFVSDQVINWSLSDERRRVELNVGVAYGTDPEAVIRILLDVCVAHPEILKEPEPEALFIAFGDSSLDFQLRAWTESGVRWINIRSDLSIAVDKAFKEARIEIPFPQRDLHLKSIASEAQKLLTPST